MWKHKNFINLQLCGFVPTKTIYVYVNGTGITLTTSNEIWADSQEYNTNFYSISGNAVVWQDGKILQYNGVDVLPTDTIVYDGQYTTRANTPQPTLTFKHFYDAGTIGSGTVKFRHYSQQEPSTGETWVLNENAYNVMNNFTYTADFVCDGTNYTTIVNSNNPMTGGLFYDTTQVVHPDNASQFVNEKYRTITFATPPTGDLLAWLQANGTKQGGAVTLINFTINGTAYQAEEGMTWQQWVNSSYNTYGCTIEGSSVKGKGNNGSPTYIYINQNLNLTLVSSTDSIIKNATYEDAAGGAGN